MSEKVTPQAFAELVGVSRPRVMKWIARGFPTEVRSDHKGGHLIDVDKGRAWIEKNVHGNKQSKSKPRAEERFADDDVEEPPPTGNLSDLSTDELYRMHLSEKVLSQRLERQQAEGQLLDRSQADLALSRALRGFARHLHRIGRNVSLDLATALRLTSEQRDIAARMIQDEIDRACATIDGGIFGDGVAEEEPDAIL